MPAMAWPRWLMRFFSSGGELGHRAVEAVGLEVGVVAEAAFAAGLEADAAFADAVLEVRASRASGPVGVGEREHDAVAGGALFDR